MRGQLSAAGKSVPPELNATVHRVDAGDEEIEATAHLDQRLLGMTWSPLGITRAPSELVVRGHLIRVEQDPSANV